MKISPLARMAEKALKRAVKEALLDHKLAGNPIAIWKNGRVVWISPEKIPVQIPKKKLAQLRLILKGAK